MRFTREQVRAECERRAADVKAECQRFTNDAVQRERACRVKEAWCWMLLGMAWGAALGHLGYVGQFLAWIVTVLP